MKTNTDWQLLKQEFVSNLKQSNVQTWLREVKRWPKNKIDSGNTRSHTVGWSTERAQVQHKHYEDARKDVAEFEKQQVIRLIRAKYVLLDKLVTLAEKTNNVREISIAIKPLLCVIEKQAPLREKDENEVFGQVREIVAILNKRHSERMSKNDKNNN